VAGLYPCSRLTLFINRLIVASFARAVTEMKLKNATRNTEGSRRVLVLPLMSP